MADFLSTLFGGGAEQEAAQKDIAAAQNYQNTVLPLLGQYYGQAQGNLQSGISSFAPLASLGATYSSGAPILMGALGAGTPDQIAAAQSAFTSSPSYNYTLNQTLDALARQRAVGGMGASGNADEDAMNYAANLSNQNYQQWINNLMQTGQMGTSATGAAAQGQASGYGALANLANQQGQNLTNVYGNVEQQTVGANNLAAAGEAAGAKNLLGAGLSLATLGMGGVGGLGPLAGLMGSSSVGNAPATGAGSPSNFTSNMYALSQGINPWA